MANQVIQQINAEMEELQKQLSQFKSSVEYLNNAKSHVGKAVDAVTLAEDNFNQRVKELRDTYHSFIQLSDAVWAVIQKIDTVNFPERLDNIQLTVKETIKNLNEIKEATIAEVQKAANAITKADFEGKFLNLQKDIDTSVKSNQQLADGIQKMKIPEKIDEFEKSISKKINDNYKQVETNTKQIAEETSNAILNLNIPFRIDKLDANVAGIMSAAQNIQSKLDYVEMRIGEKIIDSKEKQLDALSRLKDIILMDSDKKNKSQRLYFIMTWILIVVVAVAFYVVNTLR